MERLAGAEELLDGPLDDPEALAGNLRDLRRINRLLGGVRLSRLAIDRLVADPGAEVTLLDVGTGGADIPVALLADARRRGRRLQVVGVDSRAEVLEAARAARPGLERVPGLRLDVSDGRSLPFPAASFDVVHASLLLHHLETGDGIAALREMCRVARVGIVVNDLERSYVHLAGAWLLGNLLTRNRYTRNDAPLSVRRAYTRAEALELLAAAGLRPVGTFSDVIRHRYAIAAVAA